MVEWKVIARLTDKILIKRKVYSPFVFLKSIFEIFLKFEYLSYLSFKITWNKTFTFIVGLFNHNHASATQLRKIPWSNQMKTGEKTPIKSETQQRSFSKSELIGSLQWKQYHATLQNLPLFGTSRVVTFKTRLLFQPLV